MTKKEIINRSLNVEDAKASLWEKYGKSRLYITYDGHDFMIDFSGDEWIAWYGWGIKGNICRIRSFLDEAGIAYRPLEDNYDTKIYLLASVIEESEENKIAKAVDEAVTTLFDMPHTRECAEMLIRAGHQIRPEKIRAIKDEYSKIDDATLDFRIEDIKRFAARNASCAIVQAVLLDERDRRRNK